MFNNLNKLLSIPKRPSSGKSKLTDGMVYYTPPEKVM